MVIPNFEKKYNLIVTIILCLAIAYAIFRIIQLAWVCDDAFISFRYAKNFIDGNGLVFNTGENVEGYTNFLWTIIIAFGMTLGFEPVIFSQILSISAFIFTILIFVKLSHRLFREKKNGIIRFLPITALALLVHHDYHIYATSGLETSLNTMLISMGFYLLLFAHSKRNFLIAGIVLILAVLTRPDSIIFYVMSIPFILIFARKKIPALIFFLIPLLVIYMPYWVWKYSYYGYPFPNTYYAKSAYQPFFSQGFVYLWLYIKTYYIFLLIPVSAVIALYKIFQSIGNKNRTENHISKASALCLLFVFPYIFYIVRAGGDFMFARFFIPITPLMFCLLEITVRSVIRNKIAVYLISGIIVLSIFFQWNQFDKPQKLISGITDERTFYPPESLEKAKSVGFKLRQYLDGMDVRLGFYGSTAMTVYYSEAPLAIECATGLTDEYIAHQEIEERGRIGHEKKAPLDYLLKRGVNFILFNNFSADPDQLQVLSLDGFLIRILIYENEIMDELRKYPDVEFVDFQEFFDQYIQIADQFTKDRLIEDLHKFNQYYFDHNNDPERLNLINEIIQSKS